MTGKLEGRVAVITAGASGMGLASARLFAREGAAVVVADLDGAAAEAAAKTITAEDGGNGVSGGSAYPFEVDVSSVEQLRSLFTFVSERFGKLNVLFNHAGIPGPKGLNITEEEFDRTVGVNLKSQFFATQLALPLLEKGAPQASIIYTSSTSGLVASPTSPIYGMTKGGTLILMRSVAKQVGPLGIRANAICPGPTDTPMLRVFTDPNRSGLSEEDYAQQLDARAKAIPLRRAGAPEDIANAALFLASDDSAFVTGVTVPVDGGMLAWNSPCGCSMRARSSASRRAARTPSVTRWSGSSRRANRWPRSGRSTGSSIRRSTARVTTGCPTRSASPIRSWCSGTWPHAGRRRTSTATSSSCRCSPRSMSLRRSARSPGSPTGV
jgi:NAD(P)-dependent dehydrogenase (short-subunit alcohol dehydrogenase family)